jgi:PAS domain S-box-containing protein
MAPTEPVTVLIVDADPTRRAALCRLLEGEGYQVRKAASAAARAAAQEGSDVIVAAAPLADDTDGATAAIPILYLRGPEDGPPAALPPESGARVLTHPVDPARLLDAVRALLRLRRAEAAFARLEPHFSLQSPLFDLSLDAILAHDTEGALLLWNRSAEAIYGWTRPEALGQRVDALLQSHFPQGARTQAEALGRAGRWEGEVRRTRRDGSLLFLECRQVLLRDARGVPCGTLEISRDVTERTRAREALRESEERLRLAASAACLGTWTHLPARDELYWSEEMEQIFGFAPGRFDNSFASFLALVHPEDRERVISSIEAAWPQAVPGGGSFEVEFRFRHADGSTRWMLQRGQAYCAEADTPIRLVGIGMDITDRKEADRRKDEFISLLAHELRNPLAPIQNAAELLRRFSPAEPRLTRAREMIDRQVRHMARMLDDLLEVSRITRGKVTLRPHPLDLVSLVRDAVEDYRSLLEAAGLTLSLSLPDAPIAVRGDPTRLAQVIGNLLANATKFSEADGTVQVRVVRGEPGDRAVITVEDTGVGIEPELLPRLFDPFAQADQSLDRSGGGLGLGLALVKGFVELHGGDVRAESDGPGTGAAFTITLPISDHEPAETSGPATGRDGGCPAFRPQTATGHRLQTSQPQSPRVLIVEDNRDTAQSLSELLELIGCRVAVAHTGPAGVEAAEQFRPDVVLCDLGLPGMSGFEVAAVLRQRADSARALLVAVTGYGQEEARRKALSAGFDLHLTKPVRFDELRSLLAQVASEDPAATRDGRSRS